MIQVKTPQEIGLMHEGGKRLAEIRDYLLSLLSPGINLLEIEAKAQELIRQAGGQPSFTQVDGYQWATCLCLNDEIVHGIPIDYVLKDSDLVTLDIGIFYQGFHTDTAWTKLVGSEDKSKLLKAGEDALVKAINQARSGNRIGHISQAIQSTIEGSGYHIVKSLVGHGVGRNLHEPPAIPGFVRGDLDKTLPLQEGMTLAIEVIYAEGESDDLIYSREDGWTLSTREKWLSAVFEHSLAVTADRSPMILTESQR